MDVYINLYPKIPRFFTFNFLYIFLDMKVLDPDLDSH